VTTIDWPPRSKPRRRGRLLLLALVAAAILGSGATLSYYVESLWFGSLGFSDVFWTTLNLRAVVFAAFTGVTFLVLYLSLVALKPAGLELGGKVRFGDGEPLSLEPLVSFATAAVSVVVAVGTGIGMSAEWSTFALYWNAGGLLSDAARTAAAETDPIFGRPLSFYFFTLPAWRLVAGWITTLAVMVFLAAIALSVVAGGSDLLDARRRGARTLPSLRGVSAAFAAVLLAFAAQVFLSRFARIHQDHTIFAGVTYADAHVWITGLLVVSAALAVGAVLAALNAVRQPKIMWLAAAVAPAIAIYLVVGLVGWYVTSFVVKPNELVREAPYIAHNIEFTRRAYGLSRIEQVPFPAETGLEALDAENNQETLQNIRLWDWRALQDTLRQIQAIRTYYDFPDIDIDRYEIGGRVRQVMLAAREMNIERLPESSRNWINEKLIYTHGYGITMNPVNGFTPEGMPELTLKDMPVQSAVPEIAITRPEIYFGELTNTDVYVRTRQKEFNYPQGDTNNVNTYEGKGGIVLGGFVRRLLIALERGDIAKLPFSDDVSADSRLLMRRNIRERVAALAPFLIFDPDPYVVVGDDGRLFWMMDGFTASATYPYSRHSRLDRSLLNYMRNSVKAVVDAYDGTVAFYVFDEEDPIIAAYRGIFPALFKDRAAMPETLRKHVRYPELFLELQAAVYGLYHMSDPGVFYNREDLWTVASEVTMTTDRGQAPQTMEPNFVLMKLPGEASPEFVEMLPFTPANRNNLIGWIAGRSDDPNYGAAVVYDFPKTRLVDGPLQIEARVDQNAQLSGQFSLWNQQGSSVRRGALIVIPVGRVLLYAEPIYLQAEHSPMPELRLVVLALQDRVSYAPTFEGALDALLGRAPSTLASEPAPVTAASRTPQGAPAAPGAAALPRPSPPSATSDVNALISEAARDLAEYQRLTAEGRLGEAGQRLEALKQKLDRLQRLK
jgi:uncharacterized membrane protein (UPF0182 family)